jgi:DNA topoisomerase-6 subunit B
MSRGQQGIGISAAGMYGLLTTGRPMVIHTRPSAKKEAHHIELAMNTKTNRAEVTRDVETNDFPPAHVAKLTSGTRDLSAKGQFLDSKTYRTGTSVSIELEAKYQRGRGSVDEFLELTAIANPHARIIFVPPSRITTESTEDTDEELDFGKRKRNDDEPDATTGVEQSAAVAPVVNQTTETGGVIIYPRAVETLPEETKEIQPHPRGVELGTLLQMLKEAEAEKRGYSLFSFLQDKFCRVSPNTASALCQKVKLTSRTKVADVDHAKGEALFRELQGAKLPPPPTNCLAPIGVRQLLAGLLKGVKAEFYTASTRPAAVYRGRPFAIEAAVAFGGNLPGDEPARVIRFANRVPLLYQQSACSSFKAVVETNWRTYGMQHPRGSIPVGPLVVMIHMASVWVPFTSESKEAIADYDEIRREMKLALQECGRKLGIYLRKRARMRREGERRDVFQKYIGEIAKAASAITGSDARKLHDTLLQLARKKTAVADVELDEDGKPIKAGADRDRDDDEGVIIDEEAAKLDNQEDPLNTGPPGETSVSEVEPGRVRGRSKRAPDSQSPATSTLRKREANLKALSATPRKRGRQRPIPPEVDSNQPALIAGATHSPKRVKPEGRKRPGAAAATKVQAEDPPKAASKPNARSSSSRRPRRIRIGKGRESEKGLF